MKYYVNRQFQCFTGDRVVEIAAGGLDRSGPDMLCTGFKNLGEGAEYTDPREALKVAIAIRDTWNKQMIQSIARIEAGYNLDMIAACEEPTDAELHEWAEKEWEAAPKCDRCGEVIEGDPWCLFEGDGSLFCSEYCTDAYYQANEPLEIQKCYEI